jgi:hypothetical protein
VNSIGIATWSCDGIDSFQKSLKSQGRNTNISFHLLSGTKDQPLLLRSIRLCAAFEVIRDEATHVASGKAKSTTQAKQVFFGGWWVPNFWGR